MEKGNFIDIAKAYAKEERELGVDVWAKINITLYQDNKLVKILKTYDLPRSMLERWRWVVHWRYCWFVCHYPRLYVTTEYSFYDRKRGVPAGFDSALNKLISAKAQVTKIQNAIAKYTEEKKKQLFSDVEEDPIYIKALKKLEEKKQKLTEAEMTVNELVNKHILSKERIKTNNKTIV